MNEENLNFNEQNNNQNNTQNNNPNNIINNEANYNNYQNNTSNFKPQKEKKKKEKNGSKVIVPFISGMLGASLVMGVCFGIPGIKNKLLTVSTSSDSENSSEGFVMKTPEASAIVNLSDYSNTAISVAEKVLPSVVGITVTYTVNSIFGSSTGEATGSGIIISEDGYILTNNHVVSSGSSNSYYQISEATKLNVHLYNDSTDYEATVIGTDSYSDLAVLKIDKKGLTPATLGNSENVKVGEFVMAVGNPLGMDSSVTGGIVSAVNREVSDGEGNNYLAIQTDAAINSGNSGGALVNSNGEVIGVNTLKLAGNGIEGIGFAIPISTTTEIVNQLIEFQTVKRPYIGIIGTTVDDATIQRYNFPAGVYVRSIEENSPAAASNLKVGDIITKINDKEISSIEELNRIKNACKIGDTVKLTVLRNNEENVIDVVLAEAPEATEETTQEVTPTPQDEQYNSQEDPFNDFNSIWDLFR